MLLRRLYVYLVSAAGLVMLAVGLTQLGRTALLFVFKDPSAQYSREALGNFTALTLVALPVWGIHFLVGRRYALRYAPERASAIRRLYVYWACLVAALAAAATLYLTLSDLLRVPLEGLPLERLPAAQDAWATAVLLVLWALHYRMAASDRAAAGERGAAATLRRWYSYPVLLAGLMTLLAGLSSLLEQGWVMAFGRPYQYQGPGLAGNAATLLVGLALWSFHARMVAAWPVEADDRKSTLRALEGFVAVSVAMAVALVAASQMLYYAVAHQLGVLGGSGNEVLADLAGPGSRLLVFALAWLLVRRRLARDAEGEEAARQAGIRRLYTNLAALVSLAALGAGAGGLLRAVSEQLEAPRIGVEAPDWKDMASLWATLFAVGLAVWLAHWRQAPAAPERQSLSRRLYVYAALLASVLVLLASGVGLLNAVLRQVFSAHPTLYDAANLDFGRFAAVLVVAAVIGAYHWSVLRRDMAARLRAGTPEAPAELVTPRVITRRYEVKLVGASEEDLGKALEWLPLGVTYTLRELDAPSAEASPSAEPVA